MKKWDNVTTVLNRRSSSGKTTRYDSLIDRFGCSSLNLFRCSASTCGNFFTRILQGQNKNFYMMHGHKILHIWQLTTIVSTANNWNKKFELNPGKKKYTIVNIILKS